MTGSNSFWFANPSTGFYPEQISNSVRLTGDADDTKFIYTPSGDGNKKTFTFSVWVKRTTFDSSNSMGLLNCDKHPYAPVHHLYFNTDDKLYYYWGDGGVSGSESGAVYVDREFRDVSSWYHIVLNYDTTQSTKTDRIRIYVNGERQTLVASYNGPHGDHYPTEDYVSSNVNMNEDGVPIIFGAMGNGGSYLRFFSGYMAELNYIDGTNYDADNFGQTKEGVWIPKAISGLSYGTHGCRLKFQDSSSLGDDTSGEGNDRTASNLAAHDQTTDTPTNNFATLMTLEQGGTTSTDMTSAQGNLQYTHNVTGQWQGHKGTFPVSSGKWYYEVQIATRPTNITQNYGIGFFKADVYNAYYYGLAGNLGFGAYSNNATTYKDTATTGYGTLADANGETYMIAVDFDNSKIWFGLEGSWMASGDPAAGNNPSISSFNAGTYVPYISSYKYGSPNGSFIFNFGQEGTFAGTKTAGGNTDANGHGNFLYSVPSGFLAMCTDNITEPTIGPNSIEQADDNFNTVLWTGNATDTNITTVGFQPDLVWAKTRSNAYHHGLFDSVRGANKSLMTSDTAAETSHTEQLTGFLSNGFSIGDNSDSGNFVNINTFTYVAWNWKGGTTSGIDTTGQDITPSGYSFNQDAGFSVVAYTGNKTDQQGVPHGLGAKPDMVIIKDRDNASTQWVIAFPQISGNDYLYFTTDAKSTDSGNVFYFTPTTTTVEISDHDEVNKNSTKYIMYCFRSIDGYSKIGTYEGNGSTDGTYVYTGFRPRWLLIKTISTVNRWVLFDSKRSSTNPVEEKHELNPNDYSAEGTSGTDCFDFLSNGFKLLRTGDVFNTDGHTYIYMAFAEQPFKYANAR